MKNMGFTHKHTSVFNDGFKIGGFEIAANALSRPPGEYGRKVKTQMNWRGPAQAVEHVV